MSVARVLDDLARSLARPMPRRRALRLLGASFAAFAVPASKPHLARGSSRAGECKGDVRACPTIVQGAQGPDKCCGSPARRYRCAGTWFEPECEDVCQANEEPCESKLKDKDGYAYFDCCKAPDRCVDGTCQRPCPPGRQPCRGTCCRQGETCKKGVCCPNSRVCGEICCPPGRKCTFSGPRRTCCPASRVVTRKLSGRATRFCCPPGTVAVPGAQGCCPPGDTGCCDDLTPLVPGGDEDDLAPLDPYRGRTFCVRGKPTRL